MDSKEFRSLQREAGVEPTECPVCSSTALCSRECEDCGTDFKTINLSIADHNRHNKEV